MSMKVEEVELKSCGKFSEYTRRDFSPEQIAMKEREMVQSFCWRVNPVTMYFWLGSYCSLWDNYISQSPHCQAFRKFKFNDDASDCLLLDWQTHPFVCFSLKQPNMWRVVLQVLDLISMDLEYAYFVGHKVVLAVVLIAVLNAYGAIRLPLYSNDCHDRCELAVAEELNSIDKMFRDTPILSEVVNEYLSLVGMGEIVL